MSTRAQDFSALDNDAFRQAVRKWFVENAPADVLHPAKRLHWDEIRHWTEKLSRQGWIAPRWPREYGGMGLTAAQQIIYQEELERLGIARAPDMGIVMIGPLLIQYGTEEQRQRFLPRIVDCHDVWCQGYSEPGAGSDLASLRTEAVLDGDHYVVNGHKTWTTMAQDANWMFCLVRTDKEVKKQRGISFMLIDMAQPGVTVRPIINLSDHDEFCEVFLDDVRVPVENIVGEVNQGWTMAKALLGHERLFLGSPRLAVYALGRLQAMAQAAGLFDDPLFVDKFTQLRMDVEDLNAMFQRYADDIKKGKPMGADISILKIWGTETYQRVTEFMVEAAAECGAMTGVVDFDGTGVDIVGQFMNSRPATIYGGSNEIQRNILAKAVLDLP